MILTCQNLILYLSDLSPSNQNRQIKKNVCIMPWKLFALHFLRSEGCPVQLLPPGGRLVPAVLAGADHAARVGLHGLSHRHNSLALLNRGLTGPGLLHLHLRPSPHLLPLHERPGRGDRSWGRRGWHIYTQQVRGKHVSSYHNTANLFIRMFLIFWQNTLVFLGCANPSENLYSTHENVQLMPKFIVGQSLSTQLVLMGLTLNFLSNAFSFTQ